MRVLVVENYGNSGAGQVATALDEAGAQRQHVRAHLGEALPADASAHDALVVLGGGQNALDDSGSPYFPQLLELIRDFERQDRAVLGICLGSQLIARAFGGENLIGGTKEFGWRQVELTPERENDPVFGSQPAAFPIFEWHEDSFTLPEGAVRLASNDVAANQAFRIGRAVYAMQFHFEADSGQVEQWSQIFPDLIESRAPGWLAERQEHAARHAEEADAVGLAIARAWVATIRN
jgi:GMP synthase-like glutamine amidotransferase